jgi:DEAD/DEAH box helicase domain-containing protein
MLPSVLSQQTSESVKQFLRGAFSMSSPIFRDGDGYTAMDKFLDAEGALLKGPYLSIALPFRKSALSKSYFSQFEMRFTPFAHQEKAYERLSRENPLGTLIATGTGSGKTECFMYPLLEHCALQNAQGKKKGIKAIIIYPMNALATDQAKRFAKTIGTSSNLSGLSVGLFVGSQESEPVTRMNPNKEQVITCKDTLRDNPPDILLTNYKMLDYLLIRPEDQPLWRFNEPETLQYLVIDELHTFDGAQGTDLACLLRRLKYRLKSPSNHLACVGTSATVGDDASDLLEYANSIFDASLSKDAIVREDRYSVVEYLEGNTGELSSPYFENLSVLQPQSYSSIESYINGQLDAWFADSDFKPNDYYLDSKLDPLTQAERRLSLGTLLLKHKMFHYLLKFLNSEIKDFNDVISYFERLFSLPSQHVALMLESFIALVSIARRESEGVTLPFLQVRYQLWVRELARLVSTVNSEPELCFSDDHLSNESERVLPVINCRDCHTTGWVGLYPTTARRIETELSALYPAFFSQSPDVVMLFPSEQGKRSIPTGVEQKICPACLGVNSGHAESCKLCGESDLLNVVQVRDINEATENGVKKNKVSLKCPSCNSEHGLSLIGSRAAGMTSVMIHQIFGSKYNDDKKLITFSDSVQDAAHRAGFFASRTWPLMFRGMMANAIQSFDETPSLTQLGLKMGEFARSQCKSDEEFVSHYIPSNLEWLDEYQTLLKEGVLPAPKDGHQGLPSLIDLRLEWEAYSELGYRSKIGRSLENTHFATTSFDYDRLDDVIQQLQLRLSEKFGSLNHVSSTMVSHFVMGTLTHIRQLGGIDHSAFRFYVQNGDGKLGYLSNTKTKYGLYMPGFGPASRKPIFFSLERIGKSYSSVYQAKKKKTWYQNWLEKTLGVDENVMVSSDAMAVYQELADLLEAKQMFVQYDARGKVGWGINSDALYVYTNLSTLSCGVCGHHVDLPEEQSHLFDGAECMNHSCSGNYKHDFTKERFDWSQFDTEKVIAAEHTGLLEREVREQTENSFIKHQNPWDTNLLSATPTLEMGIDIGDLSSVVLCSVPPAQANYLQRIGRAGRTDGNALNVTLAQGHPHDLYFYEDPIEMMAGHVSSPGVFMGAVAVLERQLTAFCMDNWISTGVDKSQVAPTMKMVLDDIVADRKQGFPFNLLNFIEKNRAQLLEDFLSLFPNINEHDSEYLSSYIKGTSIKGGVADVIVERLTLLSKDRESLRARTKKLYSEIQKRKKSPVKDQNYQEELDKLTQERNGLNRLIGSINDKQTFNFFTDEGLLPNYAFPEAGVTLRSVLWRKESKSNSGESSYASDSFEYERPAATAISELAPDNHFYAGGYKVRIEQVDLGVSEVENWRLCSNCNHSENTAITGDTHKVCPKCGTPSWSDEAQKSELIKLRQVYARSSYRDAQILDDKDKREPNFYTRQLLVSFDSEDVNQAFTIESEAVPFGFEFLSKAKFKDINFGSPSDNSVEFEVAGERRKRGGFKVCKECGMVDSGRVRHFEHDLSCKYRSQSLADDQFIDCLYLYRELESEAIRILLPVTSFNKGSVTETSFVASINMGLKRYFKGSVGHIQGAIYSEPLNEGEGRRHFLTIYDSVPGGTGYLKELMQSPTKVFDLFALSLDHLTSCSCNADPEKDGCYKCIYAYRSSREMSTISRDRAIELLKDILSSRDSVREIESVNDIDLSALVGSELETKFIATLSQADLPLRISHKLINQKQGYELTLLESNSSDAGVSAVWYVEPQVNLNTDHGVSISSKPDFVFWPARQSMTCKPIALFLDGYQYHQSSVEQDALKRFAIKSSDKFMVWSLGWDDLENTGSSHVTEFLNQHQNTKLIQMLQMFLTENKNTLDQTFSGQNSFELLLGLLKDPSSAMDAYLKSSFANVFSWINPEITKDQATLNKLDHEIQENAPSYVTNSIRENGAAFVGGLNDSLGTSYETFESVVSLPQTALATAQRSENKLMSVASGLLVHISFDQKLHESKKYKQDLAGFWKVCNVLQFLPKASWSSRQPDSSLYSGVTSFNSDLTSHNQHPSDETNNSGWESILSDAFFESDISILTSLSVPEFGCDVIGNNDEILATPELSWPHQKVAVVTEDDEDSPTALEAIGWSVFVDPIDEEKFEKIKQELKE